MKLKKWFTIKFSLRICAFAVKNTFRKIKSVVHFLPVIVFFVAGSCNNPSTQKNVIPLEPTQKEKLELGKVSKIIKLETSPESQLGSINSTVTDFENNRIFVLSDGILFLFDSQGNFISRVKNGRGPGELYDIVNFSADKKQQLLFINQFLANHITIVDYNGKVLKNDKLKESIYLLAIEPKDENHLFLLNNSPIESIPFFVAEYDLTTDSITKTYISAGESNYPKFLWPMPTFFPRFQNRIFFASPTIFGLFEYKNNDFEKVITYDLGKRIAPPEFSEKYEKRRAGQAFNDAAVKYGYVVFMNAVFYFKNYNLVILSDNELSCYAISEKNREKVYLNGPISTYFGLPALESFKNPTEINENYLVFAVNPTDFFVENPTSDKTTVEIGNQKLEVELEENPFLVIVE